MPRVFPTPTLRHLTRQHRLEDRDLVPGEPRRSVSDFLRTLLASPDGIDPSCCPHGWLPHLETRFLTVASDERLPRPSLPFAFVDAVNFELTYGCNLACHHCLQDGLRPSGRVPWADAGMVAQALDDASWLGLARAGVNFTGGEVYLPGSPILELIELASRVGIDVRSNTNAWWGGRAHFTVGAKRFKTDSALVNHLRDIGLKVLVMSMDNRYR
jgi:sulfatase maturation enzyme AslB (radical SAM superfamily)